MNPGILVITVYAVEATGKLSKQISQFIREHYGEFLSFDDVKIYYDNGQVEVSKLISVVFNALLPNPIFRKVMPDTVNSKKSVL